MSDSVALVMSMKRYSLELKLFEKKKKNQTKKKQTLNIPHFNPVPA